MAIQIQTVYGIPVTIDFDIERCPICLHACHPGQVGNYQIRDCIERILSCPRSQCGRLFIARYQQTNKLQQVYKFIEVFPSTFQATEHNPIISQVSPDFVAIYADAENAECCGLKLICGPGYRKAVEFLIKDYVIRLHATPAPDASEEQKKDAAKKAEQIKEMPLAKCIADHVSDTKVKQVASRAVWLGNDETHYLRKWADKDVTDLKRFIKLTLHWIEMDELTRDAVAEMPAR